MSTKNSEKSKKTKKSDEAFAIYAKHLPKRDTMKKREFRALVVAELTEKLGITNKGTIGYYFSWAEQVITGRPIKEYSRGDGQRARKGSGDAAQVAKDLQKLQNQLAAAAAKKRETGELATTEFKPKGGFGTASF